MVMAGRPRSKSEIIRDRHRIASLYLKGRTQASIGEELGLSQSIISRNLATLHQEWLQDTSIDIRKAKARELARVDNLEREYWNAWERSCSERKVASAEVRADDAQGKPHKSSLRKEQRDGNPAFLRGIEWCIDKRCRILGLDAPVKVAPTNPDGDEEYTGLSLEERADRIAAILDRARARRDQQAVGKASGVGAAKGAAD